MAESLHVVDQANNLGVGSDGASIITAPSEGIPAAVRTAYQARDESPAELLRRAGVRVIYNGLDITVDLAPWVLSVEFADGVEQADDVQITLWDDGRWRGAWALEHGAKLEVEICVKDRGQTVRLPCGTFAIDEAECSGPPSTVAVRATSAWITTALRREKKVRSWEKVTLRQICETIAKKAGLTLFYSARNNPSYQRIDQAKSDLEFLRWLALREGLRLKTSDKQLIVYSQAEFDAENGIDAFHWGDGRIVSYRFVTGVSVAYCKCVVKYRDAKSKTVLEYSYVPPDAPKTGQTLRINERVESLADARKVAINRLTAANRNVREGSLDIVGDVRMVTGHNIEVRGFGTEIDGRYAIEEARHSLWPYTTSMRLRRV